MKISFELEAEETGEPIELANAIIKMIMERKYFPFNFNKNELAEIAGHIEVFLKHCEVKVGTEE